MFQLRKETDYAIQFLKLLSKQKQHLLSLNDVSVQTGISFLFLQKIAGKLRKSKIIDAEKGAAGGYFLSIPAKKISLKKIIEAVEGSEGLVACVNGSVCNCAAKAKCAIKGKMEKINKQVGRVLENIKLSNL